MKPYVGIDVSKARLDMAARPGGETWRGSNDEEGIEDLLLCLGGCGPRWWCWRRAGATSALW